MLRTAIPRLLGQRRRRENERLQRGTNASQSATATSTARNDPNRIPVSLIDAIWRHWDVVTIRAHHLRSIRREHHPARMKFARDQVNKAVADGPFEPRLSRQ